MEEKTFRSRFEAWLVNGGSRYILYGVWFFVQALIFTFAFINYKVSDNFKTVRGLFGTPLFYARASALNLHVSNGIILLPVCRNLISWMRTTPLNKVIPFDENIAFHKLVGWTIVFFTAVHVFAHVINYMTLAAVTNSSWFVLWFTNGPGWTGNLMTLALALIAGLAIKRVRTQKFEMFWYTHHLFIVYFALFSFHGTWCLVQPDREPKCSNAGAFWKYWLVSGLIYISERAIRELRGRRKTYITKVVLHPSQVVEVQIRKDGIQAKAGQYVFLNCPEVSLYQWHPFTLTSAPEEDYLSCHIRVVGDFTKDFARKLGCDVESKQPKAAAAGEINRLLPRLLIDGPFGSASEDVFNYEVAVLVGAGIGVTPFASVLKSIWYRSNYPNKATKLRKAYFFWICRDYQAFEWFQDLLKAIEDQDIENFLEIHVYLTGRLKPDELKNVMLNDEEGEEDALTGLKAPTHYGRPNLDQIFPAFKKAHPDTEVGVFFCGPKPLSKSLHTACIKYSDTWEGGTKFNYNKVIAYPTLVQSTGPSPTPTTAASTKSETTAEKPPSPEEIAEFIKKATEEHALQKEMDPKLMEFGQELLKTPPMSFNSKIPVEFDEGEIEKKGRRRRLWRRDRFSKESPFLDIGNKIKINKAQGNTYLVERLLGKSTYGEVYEVTWQSTTKGTRKVALKTTPRYIIPDDATMPKRDAKGALDLQKEYQILTNILGWKNECKKYLVYPYNLVKLPDIVFMSMEVAELGDLRNYIASNPPYIANTYPVLVKEMVLGLLCLHQAGFSHGDLKPENVLLRKRRDDSPQAILADFGYTTILNDAFPGPGSAIYAAPETFFNAANIDKIKADLFSLGATIVTMYTNAFPARPKFKQDGSTREGYGPIHFSKKIFKDAGFPMLAADLVQRLCWPDPALRIGLGDALNHPFLNDKQRPDVYFKQNPFPVDPTGQYKYVVHDLLVQVYKVAPTPDQRSTNILTPNYAPLATSNDKPAVIVGGTI